MNLKISLCLFVSAFFIASCNQKPKELDPISVQEEEATSLPENVHKVTINEIQQANSYTYLEVNEDGQNYWIAIPRREVEIGGTYYYSGGMEMEEFESKDLNRTFPKLLLVDGVQATPTSGPTISTNSPPGGHSFQINPEDVALVEGGVTIEELFKNPLAYRGKTILVKGMCVKMNMDIMNRNWLHIQDGTKDENGVNYDLTITTSGDASPGDVVTIEGKITLDKDFGAGYVYPVIMEEGKIQ